MYILGISAFYHDSACCLIKDGEILAAVQEERFTRKKHDNSFPSNAINYCLKEFNIDSSKIDYVAFYDKPILKLERILNTYLHYAPFGIRQFIKAMPLWMKRKIWTKEIIQKKLNYNGKILFPKHHESHAASAFFPSPFKKSAFLTIDGAGEWNTTSYGVGEKNNLETLANINFPHSLGLLYSAFTYFLGFKVNSGEYKVMGLAPYGQPKYKNIIYKNLIDVKEDGSFRMNMNYFDYCKGLKMTNNNFSQIFGAPPRKPESKLTQNDMDIARSIQEVTEEIVLKIATHVKSVTGMDNLCLAGGVALNSVANGKLLKTKIFDNIWIQPAAGDAGGAIGAALAVWYQYLSNERIVDENNDSMKGCFLGPQFSNDEIKKFLDKNNLEYTKVSNEEIPEKISDILNEGKIVGWHYGKMEFGPRALGARSILADARSPKMQEIMNLKIKFRESFRPFAPSVLHDKSQEWFDIDRPSPYMSLVVDIAHEKKIELTDEEKKFTGLEKLSSTRSKIPAVTHVDYSARIQTVHESTNRIYYNTIKEFNKKYNCPVIINTSFNVRGEPIVCTPEDSYKCFMATNIDYLLLENFLLKKDTLTK